MPTYQFELNDRENNAISDISVATQSPVGSYRICRPVVWKFDVPLNSNVSSVVTDVHSDGYPMLSAGRRALKVRRNGQIIFNGFVWRVDRFGDRNIAKASVVCIDPMAWWRRRAVRDGDGSFAFPVFPSPISGGAMLQQAINNSITFEGATPPSPMGIITGSNTSTVDVAVEFDDWPMFIGDLATMLGATGMVEFYINPIEGTPGSGTMGVLECYNRQGSNIAGSVNFQYAQGAYNVAQVKYVEDMEGFCNALWYYLGPRDPNSTGHENRFKRNITYPGVGLPDPPQTALNAAILSSRDIFGLWQDIRIFTDRAAGTDARPFFFRLWQFETALRLKPRELLHITPLPEVISPWDDFFLGDVVGVDVSGIGMSNIASEQRIYGFDVMPRDDGVEELGELLASADAD